MVGGTLQDQHLGLPNGRAVRTCRCLRWPQLFRLPGPLRARECRRDPKTSLLAAGTPAHPPAARTSTPISRLLCSHATPLLQPQHSPLAVLQKLSL